jgi:phage-related protein
MPDYNLGRAHGEIVITADVREADHAKEAIAGVRDETDHLTTSTEQLSRVEQERNRRSNEAVAAANRRKQAESEYRRVMADSTATIEQQNRADAERRKAIGEHLQAAKRLSEAERAVSHEVAGNTDAVARFTRTLDQHNTTLEKSTRHLKDYKKTADDISGSVDKMSKSVTNFLGIMAKGAAYGAGGLAAGGALGLLGGGGIQGILGTASAVVELSGALLLLPAAVGGVVTVFGALAIATDGVSDAFKNIEDPEKFTQSLSKMAPAAQQVMRQLQAFTGAFRGAQQVIQQGLFEPILADIQPLVFNLLPLLMNGLREVANVIGQAGHQFAVWLQMPETMKSIGIFIHNVAEGLRSLMPAMTPFLNAMTTLTTVGSTFFTQLGAAITAVANEFNNWVQTAARNGDLQRWIQTGINALGQLFDIMKNVGIALGNIFNIGEQAGGFLGFIQKLAAEFRAWTESVEGKKTLQEFFSNLSAAAETLGPILRTVAGGIGTIFNTLLKLGTAIGPGLGAFFQSFADALKELGPQLVASAPALNQFLTTLGQVLVQIVQTLGPQIPGLLKDFADIAKDLAPALTSLASALASVLSKLTPTEIETIAGLAATFSVLATVIPTVIGAITALAGVAAVLGVGLGTVVAVVAGVVVAIGLLVVASIYLYKHWDDVKRIAGEVWAKLKEFGSWIAKEFVHMWESLVEGVKRAWKSVVETISRYIDNISKFFSELPGKAWDWGSKLITNFADGIRHAAENGLQAVLDFVGGMLPDWLKPGSPTKKGPLSKTSTEQWGQDLGEGYAAGIRASADSVGSATDEVAGSAASGFGGGRTGLGTQFQSAGVKGRSGKAGQSGFEQWIEGLTTELSAWSDMAKNAFDVVKGVFDIVTSTLRVVANLWNGGNNPLTQRGGLFGKPKGPEQQQVPGVPQAPPEPGQAPDEYGRVLGGQGPQGGPPQQEVPGVPEAPGMGPTTRTSHPGPQGNAPPAPAAPAPPPPGAPAPPPPAATANVGLVNLTTKSSREDVARRIIARGQEQGYSPQQIQAILSDAAQESGLNPDIWSPNHEWYGIFQQDVGYKGRMDPNQQVDEFFKRLGEHGGTQGDIWKNIFWLQQAPGRPSAEAAYAGGRQAYLTEIQRQQNQQTAAELYNQVTGGAAPAPPAGVTPPSPGAPPPPAAQGGGWLPIPQVQTPNLPGIATTSRGGKAPDLFLMHTEEGTSTAAQLSSSMAASGQYSYNNYIDPATGQIIQAVPPNVGSVGTGGVNQRAINTVIAGSTVKWTREQWLSHPEALRNAAYLAATSGVPLENIEGNKDRNASGIGGHDWATAAGYPTDGHTDPGPNFPWDVFMGYANQYRAQGVTKDNPQGNAAPPGGPAPAGPLAPGAPAAPGAPPGAPPATNPLEVFAPVKPTPPPPNRVRGPEEYPKAGAPPAAPAAPPAAGVKPWDQLTPQQQADIRTYENWGVDPGNYNLPHSPGFAAPAAPPGPQVAPRSQEERFAQNPATRANIPLQGTTANAVAAAGLKPLYAPGTSFGYTKGPVAGVPQTIFDLANMFGLQVSTDPKASGGLHSAGFAFDLFGKPEDMDKFAEFVATNLRGQTLELIHAAGEGGAGEKRWAIAGGQIVDQPGTQAYFDKNGVNQFPQHADLGPNAHVHWATDVPPILVAADGSAVPVVGQAPTAPPPPAPGAPGQPAPPAQGPYPQTINLPPSDSDWMRLPAGWDPKKPIPMDVRQAHGIPDTVPDIFYSAAPGPVANVPNVPGSAAPTLAAPPQPGTPPPTYVPPGQVSPQAPAQPPGEAPAQGAQGQTPMDMISSIGSGISSIAGQAFKVFDDIIQNITATAELTAQLVRGIASTDDINKVIDNIQTFITTAADIAQLVSSSLSFAGGLAGMGGAVGGEQAAAGLQAASAIAAIVSAALTVTNAAIDLTQQGYAMLTKYGAIFAGYMLGGPETGPLGGNVRMLLNTQTGDILAYSQENPEMKETKNLPDWLARSYGGNRPGPGPQQTQVNIYTGPGTDPKNLVSDTMWLVSSGAATTSVAGVD